MKKHTTYYVIGAVLIGAGIYLYKSKKDAKNTNLTPPKEVKEDEANKTPESATPPYVSAYDAIKKLLDSIKLNKSTTATPTTTNQTV